MNSAEQTSTRGQFSHISAHTLREYVRALRDARHRGETDAVETLIRAAAGLDDVPPLLTEMVFIAAIQLADAPLADAA